MYIIEQLSLIVGLIAGIGISSFLMYFVWRDSKEKHNYCILYLFHILSILLALILCIICFVTSIYAGIESKGLVNVIDMPLKGYITYSISSFFISAFCSFGAHSAISLFWLQLYNLFN